MRFLIAALCLSAPLFGAGEAKWKDAAVKSLRLLESVQAEWKQQCFSCHHQSLPVMAVAASRKASLPVNEAVAAKVGETALGALGAVDLALEDAFRIDPAFGTGMTLVAAAAGGVEPSLAMAIQADRLASVQMPDGHWATFDARPPSSYSVFAATAISARAVGLYAHASRRGQAEERQARAARWLAAETPKSVEDAAWQLVGLAWLNAPEAAKAGSAQRLLKWQNQDGGWGQLPGEGSDAYATARALHALGRKRGGAAWDRGMDWLLKAQLPDGSWHVATRIQTPARISPPYFESGFPHGKDQYISCAATAWALLAMAEALPQTGNGPSPVAAARARGVEPWMEKAYFGTVDELRALLDGGLNPNAATPEGNSLLMFAAHDAAKVRLLLARGADVKFRSKSGFDALMVSTLVRGRSDAAKALLDAGAEVNPKARTRFRANPLSLAAVSGDAATMRVLLDAGANPQAVMAYVGIVMMRPFEMAAQFGYEAVVRLMAERGYQVDSPDDQGMTALTWAGIMHRPETARLLMQLGANPAHKDNYGLTPAQEAETIRYAPQEVLQVLKSGGGR